METETWPEKCTCKAPPGISQFCPEHGGMWSYKCGACLEHLRQEEDGKNKAWPATK